MISSKAFLKMIGSLAICGTALIGDAEAANLLINGNFDTGYYTSTLGGYTNTSVPDGWTPNAGYDQYQAYNHVVIATGAESGPWYLSISNYDFQALATLSQTFADVSGASYTVSYWAFDGGANGDSNAFLKVSAGSGSLTLGDTIAGPWQNFTFNFVGNGTDTITIAAQTNPSEWYVDNVSVSGPAVSAVPEASTWAMMLIGFAGFGFAGYRQSKKHSATLAIAQKSRSI